MNTIHWLRKALRGVSGGLAVLSLTGAALVAVPVATAFADEGTPTPQAPGLDKERAERLENLFQREQQWLNTQSATLARAGTIAGKVQGWIDTLKSKGVDVSALEAALATFRTQVASAQAAHDRAASILSAHAGFNPNGKAVHLEEALETVKSAGKALRESHQILRQAGQDLRRAIREFRQAHRTPAQ